MFNDTFVAILKGTNYLNEYNTRIFGESKIDMFNIKVSTNMCT